MSMTIVCHVLDKSQAKGSARTLLLTLAIHANGCCGVAWPSDTTLCHEVNVSRQRIHELKNTLKASSGGFQPSSDVYISRPVILPALDRYAL